MTEIATTWEQTVQVQPNLTRRTVRRVPVANQEGLTLEAADYTTPSPVDEKPTLGERYSNAVAAGLTDADILLAAGYVAQHNEHGLMALSLWRMRETKDATDFNRLAEHATKLLIGKTRRPGRHQLPELRRYEAEEVARITLQWWLDDTCPTCEGRAHPTIPGTARLHYGHDCQTCEGTGKLPVSKVIRSERRDHARFLASEFDAMAGAIFRDMAARLRPNLDL